MLLNFLFVSLTDCAWKLGKALFFVGEIGGNDYNYAFFSNKTMAEVEALVPHVVDSIKDAVKVSFCIPSFYLFLLVTSKKILYIMKHAKRSDVKKITVFFTTLSSSHTA